LVAVTLSLTGRYPEGTMKTFAAWHLVLGIVFLTLSSAGRARADLAARFQDELKYKSRVVSNSAQTAASRFQYVFIAGLNNELAPGYFKDNVASVKKEFLVKQVTVLRPRSHRSVEVNALLITKKLKELFYNGGQVPMIIVSHSKGGLEVLQMAVTDPDFFNEAVAKFITIQTPFGGSKVADAIFKTCPKKLPKFHLWCNEGYRSLTTPESTLRLQRQLSSLTDEQAAGLFERLRLVRASESGKGVSLILKATNKLLEKHAGPNDGIVLLDEQRIPGADLDLAILKGDHTDFVTDWTLSNERGHFRKAFTRALLLELFNLPH
jgi:hypothetical protein